MRGPNDGSYQRVHWAAVLAVLGIVGLGIASCTTAVLVSVAVAAHPAGVPHDDSAQSLWFTRQHSARGGWFCDASDAFYPGDDEWVSGRDGYRVKLGDQWWPVPEGAVRDPAGGPNPTGSAVIWFVQETGAIPTIYCFSPGFQY